MSTTPDFVRPSLAWFALLDGGIASLAVLASSQKRYDAVSESVALPPRSALKALLAGAVALHVGEAAYVHRLARKHGLPAGRWARQTFIVGFPSTLAIRRLVAEA